VQASRLLSISRVKRQTKYSSYLISIPKKEEGRNKKEEAIKSMVWAMNNVNHRRGCYIREKQKKTRLLQETGLISNKNEN
jgi:hypothetical protein